jgi:pimeloyl-ACP methyl ester carboxylesterase
MNLLVREAGKHMDRFSRIPGWSVALEGNGMRLARLVPGARYVELPGVGHLVPLEAPDPLADVIEEQ